jgi:ubiquinone/menaquinone biosynthesis C-methylase UbiE
MTTEFRHPCFARLVAFVAARAEGTEEDDLRRDLLAGLTGRVIEIGSGSGPNFRLYPGTVTELVAIEPESYLRAKAERAAERAAVRVRVVDALAGDLPFEDGSFDAAVAALVLCSVPSQATALAELRRVVRPGGELRFYEHVLARSGRLFAVQRLAAPVTQRLAGGCRPDHDTAAAIEAAGFRMERCRRFVQRSVLDALGAPRIIGTARRP